MPSTGTPELVQPGSIARRVIRVNRCRPAAQDRCAAGLRRRTSAAEIVVSDELGVDAALADAARDQLGVLAAEVEDEHRPVLRASLGVGERDDRQRRTFVTGAGSSARPS